MTVTAHVFSAETLKESQLSALGELLSRKLNKQVDILAETDPAVLGGLRIHVDGRIIDRTVKRLLEDMKNSIL